MQIQKSQQMAQLAENKKKQFENFLEAEKYAAYKETQRIQNEKLQVEAQLRMLQKK